MQTLSAFPKLQMPTDQTDKMQHRDSEAKGGSSQTQLPPLPPSQTLLSVPLRWLARLGHVSGILQSTGAGGECACLLEAASESLRQERECGSQS